MVSFLKTGLFNKKKQPVHQFPDGYGFMSLGTVLRLRYLRKTPDPKTRHSHLFPTLLHRPSNLSH